MCEPDVLGADGHLKFESHLFSLFFLSLLCFFIYLFFKVEVEGGKQSFFFLYIFLIHFI